MIEIATQANLSPPLHRSVLLNAGAHSRLGRFLPPFQTRTERHNPKPMKPTTHSALCVRIALAATLTVLVSVSALTARASDADELRRLREENAALRKRIADLEVREVKTTTAPAAAAAAAAPRTSTSTTSTAAVPTDSEVMVMSPFQINSDKDYGYLLTNSATATRIGMEIQKIPLSISVFSEDFIRDTGMREIQDVMRYSASAAGDTRQGVKPPGNSATPSGTFTLRGFPVSSRLRNGLNRYSYYNMDTVERIEVIKGPAAVFFGQGFPGGVINYVTKQPEFSKRPTTLTYSYGGNEERMGAERVSFDENNVFSKRAAMRLIGVWDDNIGSQRDEFKKAFTFAPSVTFIPFESGKLRLKAEFEYAKSKQNAEGQGWIYPEQWFADYKNPSPALLAAAGVSTAGVVGPALTVPQYQARIFNNVGAWIQDVRRVQQGNNLALGFDASNNYVPPTALWTFIDRGARYTARDGTRIYDSKFNNRGVGSIADNTDSTIALTAEADPTTWLNARYSITRNNATYSYLTSQAAPYADGNRMNFTSGLSYRGDKRDNSTHQLDLVFKKELFRIKNKVLVGGVYDHTLFNYYGNSGFLYTNIPGAALPGSGALPGTITNASTLPFIPANIAYPGTDPTLPTINMNLAAGNNAPGSALQLQQLYSRTGVPLTATQVFSEFDPGLHPLPDVRRITGIDRALVDRYNPKKEEYYINYLATLFDDRLNLFAGYRTSNEYDGEQRVSPNPPWFNGYENLLEGLTTQEQRDRYGISNAPGSYHVGTYLVKQGHSSMYGASFALTKELTAYASYSQTFLPNTGFLGLTDENLVRIKAPTIGLNPDTEIARIRAAGANSPLKNEEGKNYEFGVKTSLWDNKVVGTFSVFRLLRTNEKLDDTQRQLEEPLNYSAPNKGGAFNTGNGGVRWYSNSSSRKVEGTEAEVIWSPRRNYQVFANASWLWTAKTTADPRFFNPATPPAGATPAQIQANNQNYYFTYNFRLPNVPEYRFNMQNRYTFLEGPVRGLAVTLGARYSSVMNISNDINADSKRGGVTAGDYIVFDGGASFPWAVFGFKFGTSLHISNLTNKEYNEGSGGLSGGGFMVSPPRTWLLTNTLRF
jgi:outer membrane receptor protein involved in Fe transport